MESVNHVVSKNSTDCTKIAFSLLECFHGLMISVHGVCLLYLPLPLHSKMAHEMMFLGERESPQEQHFWVPFKVQEEEAGKSVTLHGWETSHLQNGRCQPVNYSLGCDA